VARLPAACLRLRRRVAGDVALRGILRPGERALLLLSGGADSMALFSLLPAVDRSLDLGLDLAALHVDYGMRGAASDRDRLIVTRACEAAGMPLHVERVRGLLAGGDFQSRARELRYARARELAAEQGYDVLVTAHNRDDQAETILYRLAKYATPRGLAGMRPRDGDLARPLLAVGAAELRDYCRAAGVEYGEDASNAAPVYARNVLRLEVLPRLEALNPRLAETLAATAEQAQAEAQVLAAVAAEARTRVTVAPACGELAVIDIPAFAAEPPAVRALVLHEVLREAMGGEALVERRLVEALLRLTARADDAGRVSLGRGLEAVRGAGLLRIRAVRPPHACAPTEADGAALGDAGDGGLAVSFCGRAWRVRLLRGAAFDLGGARAGEAFAGLSAAPRRVTLRHPRRGERFAPLGLGRETTLARYLAAQHVAADARPLVPVLDVDGRAVWVGHAPAAPGGSGSALPGRVAQEYRVGDSSVLTLHVVQEGM
jgi:tRNA(Ile)-lysidine synthase